MGFPIRRLASGRGFLFLLVALVLLPAGVRSQEATGEGPAVAGK